MSDEKRDPYDVLHLPRDADARAIKASYFALVREFPPETHAAEFQELRDAYELLADPERRAQLDASRDAFADLAAEQAALLRAAQHALGQGDAKGGIAMLRRLVADAPDLRVAREQLGFALLRTRAYEDARPVWTELVERDPKNPRYHLHLGYACQGCRRTPQALDCYREALTLGGGDEARLALADALGDAGDWRESVKLLDEGIAAAAAPPLPLLYKKLARLLVHADARTAWTAFDQLTAAVARGQQERAACADELASMAGWLFSRDCTDRANELLARLPTVDPDRKPARLFPSKVTVHAGDLPPSSLAWLEGKVEQPPRWVQTRQWRLRSLLAIVPGVVLLWCAVAYASGGAASDPDALVGLGVVFLATAIALALGGRRFHAALASPLPRMTLVHPAYYLDVVHDWIDVYPLVNLHDVQLVRHSTNGVYTHTLVRLPFGTIVIQLSIRDAGQAQQLAEALLARRRRLLELMSHGLIESEPGMDLVPAPILAGGGRRPRRWPLLAGAAAATAVAMAVIVAVNVPLTLERDWAVARGKDTPAAYRDFQRQHPSARDRVGPALAAWTERAETGSAALPAGPARERALALLHALVASRTGGVALTVRMPPADGGAVPAGGARCQLAPDKLRKALTLGLQVALDQALGAELGRVGPPRSDPAVTVDVALARGADAVYAADTASTVLHASRLDWSLTVRPAGAAPTQAHGTAAPPETLELRRRAQAVDPGPACLALTGAQTEDLQRQLWGALGLVAASTEVQP